MEEKQWGMFCHLSALVGLLHGGLTFLGPLVCWLVKKDTSRFVDDQGKEALNFQITLFIGHLIGGATACITFGASGKVASQRGARTARPSQ